MVEYNLETDRILLREWRFSDIGDIYVSIRDSEISKWMLPPPFKFLRNPAGRFVCRILRLSGKGLRLICIKIWHPKIVREYKFSIVFKDIGKVIGVVTILKYGKQEDCARIGFWIGKKHWGRGLATEAVKLALGFGFKILNLNSIDTWTFGRNTGSIRVLEKCGFKLKNIVRDAYIKFGQKQDRLNYRILKAEFENLQQQDFYRS
jgi:RimJ/RimL family protein N-acetyltransferase